MKQTRFVVFLIITFIFVVAWVSFSIYHILNTSKISGDLKQEITPIDGTFDSQTINTITHLKNVSPLYSNSAPTPTSNGSTTPTPGVSSVPLPSITVETTPKTATNSGGTQ
ncbi:MAG TPA: hypothetical protein VMR41_01340 [Patescibacteria group bacterium]|nr:hypothetical protein [Patescibacteria group bacterium]